MQYLIFFINYLAIAIEYQKICQNKVNDNFVKGQFMIEKLTKIFGIY